jgi:membrane protease YdiL (CAAX protease family)
VDADAAILWHAFTGLVIWLILAACGGIGVLLLWPKVQRLGRLLPLQRQRAVPWQFAHVGLALIAYFLWIQVVWVLLDLVGWFSEEDTERLVWAALAAAPAQWATIFGVLRYGAGARHFQMGLSLHRLTQDILAGYLFWLVSTPAVLAVYVLARYVVMRLGGPIHTHPLEDLLQTDAALLTRVAVILVAVVTAPAVEELLARGVIQPWLIVWPRAADLVVGASVMAGIAWAYRDRSAWPLLLLLRAPGYLAFCFFMGPWLRRPGAARGIFAASLLFAAAHVQVWPSPIPLFLLSLGLGFLAYRTQSLVGPIVLHALFNSVSVLYLLGETAAL